MSVDTPDIIEVKRCLEEAGCYDEAMSKDDKIATYKAIKSSEDTANVEIQQRIKSKELSITSIKSEEELSNNNPITPFKARQWSTPKRLNDTITLTTPKKPKSAAEEINERMSLVDMYDAVPSKHKPLQILHYKPKLVPFYCHSSIQSLPIKEKIKLIQQYHLKLSADFSKIGHNSINFAPWGNPIHANTKFNGSLEKRPNNKPSLYEGEPILDSSPLVDTTYISRGGRQIKRKTYMDWIDDDETEKKKQKADIPKTMERKPANKLKLTNLEIMNRSALFADSPKSSRTDKLMSNSVEEEEKKKKSELEMGKFEATLLQADDDDDFDIKVTSSRFPSKPAETVTSSSQGDDVNPNFVKLTVIPAVAGRKGIKRAQTLQPVKPAIPSTSSASSSNRSNSSEAESSSTKRNQKVTKKKTKCPICNHEFLQEDIEEHASTCGLTNELEIENNIPNKDTASNLTCNLCDEHFPFNNDYEIHVRDCIQKHRMK